MASCRFLISTSFYSRVKLFSLLIIGSVLIMSCGTTKETQDRTPGPETTPEKNTTPEDNSVNEEFLAVMNANRSMLSDVYSSLENDIPSVFLQESTARDIGDPNQGYRIQILSTRNVAQADSMANDFRSWAQSEFLNYIPKAYVFFRQPYYKVHIGNFQFHDHAMKLNQLIKDRYPDAWVVHDEVEPDLVPADTSDFRRR